MISLTRTWANVGIDPASSNASGRRQPNNNFDIFDYYTFKAVTPALLVAPRCVIYFVAP